MTIYRYYCKMHDKIDIAPQACSNGFRQMAKGAPVTCEMVSVRIESTQ